ASKISAKRILSVSTKTTAHARPLGFACFASFLMKLILSERVGIRISFSYSFFGGLRLTFALGDFIGVIGYSNKLGKRRKSTKASDEAKRQHIRPPRKRKCREKLYKYFYSFRS